MDEDRVLFDWLRHYSAVVVLFTLLGLGLASLYRAFDRSHAESWSVVIQTEDRIPALHLGFVTQSLFRSASVYGPVMRDLGIDTSPERFLTEQAELRPVAETHALIVIGRAATQTEADLIAARLTQALIDVFDDRGLSTLRRFGRAVPIPEDITGPVALVTGTTSGFWLGLGFSLIHYRLRRPVLGLSRAAAITTPQRVTVVDGPWPRWLGALRPLRRAERAALGSVEPRRVPTRRWTGAASTPRAADAARRLVAGARTSEHAVRQFLATDPRSVHGVPELVWIR